MQPTPKISQAKLSGASGHAVAGLRFTGDVSSASREAIAAAYAAAGKEAPLLLDFKGVDYLNSSGIALIIQILIEASKAGQTVAISGLTPHFVKVFTMVGITKYAKLYTDEANALQAL